MPDILAATLLPAVPPSPVPGSAAASSDDAPPATFAACLAALAGGDGGSSIAPAPHRGACRTAPASDAAARDVSADVTRPGPAACDAAGAEPDDPEAPLACLPVSPMADPADAPEAAAPPAWPGAVPQVALPGPLPPDRPATGGPAPAPVAAAVAPPDTSAPPAPPEPPGTTGAGTTAPPTAHPSMSATVLPAKDLPSPPLPGGVEAPLIRPDGAAAVPTAPSPGRPRAAAGAEPIVAGEVPAPEGPLRQVATLRGLRATASAAPPDGVARVIVGQLAEGLRGTRAPVIEITLDPAELGVVLMRLSPEEDGLRVLVSVERPETADLLRRHAALLERALREIGHAAVTVDIDGGALSGRDRGFRPAPEGAGPVLSVASEPGVTVGDVPLTARGALDMRL